VTINSNALQIFVFNDGNEDLNSPIKIRGFLDYNNEPIFIAKDVAVAMGYINTKDAIIKHCDNTISVKEYTDSKGRGTRPLNEIKDLHPQTRLIREPDVYELTINSH
jgi:prophage antirepressor-like protein